MKCGATRSPIFHVVTSDPTAMTSPVPSTPIVVIFQSALDGQIIDDVEIVGYFLSLQVLTLYIPPHLSACHVWRKHPPGICGSSCIDSIPDEPFLTSIST
jgi:hypothetical protein